MLSGKGGTVSVEEAFRETVEQIMLTKAGMGFRAVLGEDGCVMKKQTASKSQWSHNLCRVSCGYKLVKPSVI